MLHLQRKYVGLLFEPAGHRPAIPNKDVLQNELTDSNIVPQIKKITRERFLADKIQCIAERSEARDLILSWLKEGG
jgi:hypothetical protein